MGDLPFLPLWVDDYEAATAHLSVIEDGAYMRLLRLMWRSPGCSIPDDQRWIQRHLRVDAKTYIEVVHPLIGEFFTKKNGKIFQRRLMAEWQRSTALVEKRSAAGKQAAAAKSLKKAENGSTIEQRLNNHPQPQPEPYKNNLLPSPEPRETASIIPISDELHRLMSSKGRGA